MDFWIRSVLYKEATKFDFIYMHKNDFFNELKLGENHALLPLYLAHSCYCIRSARMASSYNFLLVFIFCLKDISFFFVLNIPSFNVVFPMKKEKGWCPPSFLAYIIIFELWSQCSQWIHLGCDSYGGFSFFVQFVMEIWRIMDEKEVHVNNRCYMLSIQALCKGGYLEEV